MGGWGDGGRLLGGWRGLRGREEGKRGWGEWDKGGGREARGKHWGSGCFWELWRTRKYNSEGFERTEILFSKRRKLFQALHVRLDATPRLNRTRMMNLPRNTLGRNLP